VKKKKSNINIRDYLKLPNIISLLRLFVSVFIFIAAFFDIKIIIVQVFYVVFALSDKADGMIARRFKMETRLGFILEPIADGALIFASIFFITLKTDFPQQLLLYAINIFLFGLIFSLLVYLFTKKWFSFVLPINRAAVFLSHVLIVFFIFSLPYRQEFAFFAFYLGLVFFAYYIVKMLQFTLKNWKF